METDLGAAELALDEAEKSRRKKLFICAHIGPVRVSCPVCKDLAAGLGGHIVPGAHPW